MLYRCYLLNRGRHILAADEFEAETLGEAVRIADDKMRQTQFAAAVELWQGDDKLCEWSLSRKGGAGLNRC